ncbi:hypothetical protein REPUB_Repub06bG0128900 [Reevesia pubescens]
MAKKYTKWQTSQGEIESTHLPICSVNYLHQTNVLKASPLKSIKNLTDPPNPNDIKNILEQNNYTNLNLNTIGQQLEKIETLIESKPIIQLVQQLEERKTEQKSFFKPFEIPKKYQQEFKTDVLQEIQQRLRTLDSQKYEIIGEVPETPQTFNQASRTVNMIEQNSKS